LNLSRKTAKHTRVRTRRDGGISLAFWLMMLPGLILLFAFAYLPMGGVIIAFKNYRPIDGIFGSAWAGLENFRFLFGSGLAWRITWNTLALNTLFITSGTLVSLGFALLLNEVRLGKRGRFAADIYQSIFFFPFFVSYVIVGYLCYAILNADTGILNRMLMVLKLEPVNWYASPEYWPVILMIINLWKNVGYGIVIYSAGILAIEPTYYEASRIDGATKWQQVRFITLPLLWPLIVINLLLSVGRIFYADFGLFFNVTRDAPLLYPTTDVIDTFVFRALRQLGDFGMAGAAAFFQSIVGFALIYLSNWLVKRRNPELGLF
jgi:putative aldouronate transport system permease protein